MVLGSGVWGSGAGWGTVVQWAGALPPVEVPIHVRTMYNVHVRERGYDVCIYMYMYMHM